MNKFWLIFLSLFFSNIFGQKCENLIQNIDANGHFNIFTIEDNKYFRDLNDSITIINPIKNNNQITLSDFQSKFPDIYDGKCLKINDRKVDYNNLKICDEKQKNKIKEKGNITFGSFLIDSKFDEFYILKFSGFEITSYLIIDTKSKKVIAFESEPKFSTDKKFIFGYSNDYNGFVLNVREIGYERSMRYQLHGTYDINEIKLIQFRNTSNFEILLDLKELIKVRNDKYDVIDNKTCNLKLGIN